MLRAGIVGLPNVGKSTLFNALTAQSSALAANYPFATIEPNVGVVPVPDERLEPLAKIVKTTTIVPATVEFVDIAGLVRGASKGEGLGNQFLANIRETDAVIQVVRCFEDENIHHVEGSVDPRRDIDTIQVELALADLSTVERRREKRAEDRQGRRQDGARSRSRWPTSCSPSSPTASPRARPTSTTPSAPSRAASSCSPSSRPSTPPTWTRPRSPTPTRTRTSAPCARSRLRRARRWSSSARRSKPSWSRSRPKTAKATSRSWASSSSGVDRLIKSAYRLLGLMSFLTAGEKEVRAWTVPRGTRAPQAAGTIHTDIERGFIKAEIVSYDDLVRVGSNAAAREQGLLRLEGKEYVMQEGDVVHFRFNV